MSCVDLLFPVRGEPVPLDHGYLLFSALSHFLPDLHAAPDIGVFNLKGTRAEEHLLHVDGGTLRLRCPAEAIARLLPLAGRPLKLAGRTLSLGTPRVHALATPGSLSSRLVTFKHAVDAATFEASTHRFLGALECVGTPVLGRRRVVRVSGKKVVGFALTVRDLSPESSLRLQTRGLGGRRHMGCGLFLPTRLSGSA